MAAMTAQAPWAFPSTQPHAGDISALEASWTKEEVSTGVNFVLCMTVLQRTF